MTTELVISLLGVILTPFLTFGGVVLANRKNQAVQQQRTEDTLQEIKRDIARLEEKQDKYNGLKDRCFELEKQVSLILQRLDG